MKTYYPREIDREFCLIDAEGKVLGRLASRIATLLRGKHKTCFTPSVDTGDHVVVVNAEKLVLTGNKKDEKEFFSHSGFPGGAKLVKVKTVLAKNPERVLMKAVKGMLPQNRLGRAMLRKLRVYAGPSHPHQAQKPVVADG